MMRGSCLYTYCFVWPWGDGGGGLGPLEGDDNMSVCMDIYWQVRIMHLI